MSIRRPVHSIESPKVGIVLASAALAVALSGGITFAAVSSNSSASGKLPPGKQQALDRAAADHAKIAADARTKVKPAIGGMVARDSQRLPARVGGMNTEVHSGPMRADQFTVTDSWQGLVAGHWLYVIAGSDLASGGTGAVAVYTLPVDPNVGNDPVLIGTYDARGTTSLAIASVHGTTVRLSSAAATTLTFDLSNRTYS